MCIEFIWLSVFLGCMLAESVFCESFCGVWQSDVDMNNAHAAQLYLMPWHAQTHMVMPIQRAGNSEQPCDGMPWNSIAYHGHAMSTAAHDRQLPCNGMARDSHMALHETVALRANKLQTGLQQGHTP